MKPGVSFRMLAAIANTLRSHAALDRMTGSPELWSTRRNFRWSSSSKSPLLTAMTTSFPLLPAPGVEQVDLAASASLKPVPDIAEYLVMGAGVSVVLNEVIEPPDQLVKVRA